MRYGMRIGRRSWVTGGGGVLAFSMLSGLSYAVLMLAIYLARSAFLLALQIVGIGHAAYLGSLARRLRPDTSFVRVAQLAAPLRASVSMAAAKAASKVIKLWAVYAVGEDFHHGLYPRTGEELLQLYLERAHEIVRIALFPDARRARSAAAQLERMGYSYQEFLALFPDCYTPPGRSPTIEQGPPNGAIAPTTVMKERIMSTDRDYTQYTFDGHTSGKGRLVLALVQRYVRDDPGAAFSDVQAAFPDNLQADSPTQFSDERCVVARLEDLSNVAQRRYFVAEGEPITLRDCVAVVSREWNLHNIQNVLEAARKLGYAVAVEPKVR